MFNQMELSNFFAVEHLKNRRLQKNKVFEFGNILLVICRVHAA